VAKGRKPLYKSRLTLILQKNRGHLAQETCDENPHSVDVAYSKLKTKVFQGDPQERKAKQGAARQ
jgi:hypothetical protein